MKIIITNLAHQAILRLQPRKSIIRMKKLCRLLLIFSIVGSGCFRNNQIDSDVSHNMEDFEHIARYYVENDHDSLLAEKILHIPELLRLNSVEAQKELSIRRTNYPDSSGSIILYSDMNFTNETKEIYHLLGSEKCKTVFFKDVDLNERYSIHYQLYDITKVSNQYRYFFMLQLYKVIHMKRTLNGRFGDNVIVFSRLY
jgi:hypothetical protein